MSNKNILLDSNEIIQLFNNGIAKAIEENKKLNIPSVFSINGKQIFQMPNGEIITKYDYSKDNLVLNNK